MGIGAFGYYRRVVENQKDSILERIIEVAKKVDAGQEIVESLEKVKSESQFSKAINEIKPGIPQIY